MFGYVDNLLHIPLHFNVCIYLGSVPSLISKSRILDSTSNQHYSDTEKGKKCQGKLSLTVFAI